jgi:flagellar hook-length control protein FliK
VQSHLSLELPNLGKVRASLQLIGNRLSLSIVADHAHTTHALRARSQALIDAFKAHPVKLKAISIAQEQQDDG